MNRILCLIVAGLGLITLMACGNKEKSNRQAAIRNSDLKLKPVADLHNPTRIEVIESWPHDPEAFTQGLIFIDGLLYEGTGGNGQSSLREWELPTGRIRRRIDLESKYFGEGITRFHDKIYQLTWLSQTALVYDALTFQPIGTFHYSGQGWGLTHNDTCLIMSDGSDRIRFIDPRDFHLVRRLSVTFQDSPVININELEWIKGEIWANIWMSNWIARIDPGTGQVNSWIDLSDLYTYLESDQPVDVLNGIAYDADGDRILVTGKYWPKIFSIRLKNPD